MAKQKSKTSMGWKFAKFLKVKNQDMASKIFDLIFETESPKDSLKFSSLFAAPLFNLTIKDLINNYDFLGRDMEWVLVIPLEKYFKDGQHRYELIFGRGQELNKKDLFLYWDNDTKEIRVSSFKFDESKRDVMSLYEAEKLITGYSMSNGVHPHQRISQPVTIENIKENLEAAFEEKFKWITNDVDGKSCLLKVDHLKTELRYLNVLINLLKGSCVIFLRDIFDSRYSFHKKGKIHSIEYDAYAIVRKFLRRIEFYPERRAGAEERFRLSKEDWDVIEDSIQRDKKEGIFIFAPTFIKPLNRGQKIKYMYDVVALALTKPIKTLSSSYQEKLIELLNKYL